MMSIEDHNLVELMSKFSNVVRVQNFIAIPNLSLVSSLGQTFGLTDDPVEP